MPKTLENPFTADFASNVSKTMTRWHVPGMAIAVVQDSKTWTQGYGNAQKDVPVDSSTLFHSASTTKAMLGACWAIYIASPANESKPAHDKISFSTPLVDIIGADFALPDPVTTRQITIEDSLSHRTGLARHDLIYGWEKTSDLRRTIRALRHLPISHPLRTRFLYCNTPFMAATLALEIVTGRSFNDYIKEALWHPLGMKNTFSGYKDAEPAILRGEKIMADGHTWSKVCTEEDEFEKGEQLVEGPMKNLDIVAGAGSAISCAEDYARWMRALLQLPIDPSASSSSPDNKSPLTEAMLQDLFAARTIIPLSGSEHSVEQEPFDGNLLLYAVGWFVSSYKGHRVIWHLGGLVGAGSLVMVVPDLKFGVSLFANGEHGGARMRCLAMELLDEVLEIPLQERDGQKRCDEAISRLYAGYLEGRKHARKAAYPDAPDSPTVPHALPLNEYAGEYFHPAYGPITIEVSSKEDKEALFCAPVRPWMHKNTFEHVNAENWFVTSKLAQNAMYGQVKARSRIGGDGKVEGFEIAMEPAMPNEMIYFARSP